MIEFLESELGRIPNHWSGKPIGDMAFVTKLAGYEYTKFFKYIDDGEIIALRALNVREGNLDLTQLKRISREVSDALPRSKLIKGDILFTYVGANIGQFALINEDNKYHLAPNICLIRPNKNCDAYFVYSYFRTNFFRENLSNYSVGSSQPTLPMGNIRKIILPCPPIEEQKAIASILSSLDDKIDLLHRQNTTLERMAETLFRQWLVEEAQEDWEVGTLKDEFDFTMGQSPSGASFNDEGLGISMFQGNADFGFRFPTERVYTTEPTRFAEPMDTLISVRAPVGAQNMAKVKCCIGRGVAAFRYKKDSSFYSYTYFKLRSLMEDIKQFNDEGTVFGSIGKTDFENLVTTIPNDEDVLNFEREVKPVNDKIINNCEQIQTLEKLRDNLLPKLMSGEVKVI